MGRSRYKITEENKPHFITCTTVNWIALFSNPDIVNSILNSLAFLQANQRIRIYAYVIMHNHLHLILSSNQLSKEIAIFKSFTARNIIDHLKKNNAFHILKQLNFHKLQHKSDRNYQVWQEGCHPQLIVSEEMFFQKAEYIHYNPVRCGFIDKAEDWRYSSARDYSGQQGLIPVCKAI